MPEALATVKIAYTGLKDRVLISRDFARAFHENHYICRSNRAASSLEVEVAKVPDLLPELVGQLVNPIFGRFALFEASPAMIKAELDKMMRR